MKEQLAECFIAAYGFH